MGLGRRLALVGAPLLPLNPLLASTAGQETMLAVTAVAALLWVTGSQRPWLIGVVAGLTVLVRLDLIGVVLTTFALRPGPWRSAHKALPAVALVALPWYLFSWVVLGSFIPDTFQIRAHQSPGGRSSPHGCSRLPSTRRSRRPSPCLGWAPSA